MVVSARYDKDVELTAKAATGVGGRHVMAVIGIDGYQHWPRLSNAVRDATGAAELFQRLGFEELTPPLLDDRATGEAIQSLVTDDLVKLGPDDSLVLFYAGHGGTRKHRLGEEVIKTGYLIPVDASASPDRASTWMDLEGWLRAVSLLPARHILVILDACHSGIALDPIIKWRDIGSWQDAPLATLQARRSRRIITSGLDDQVALDSGPVQGHSLFTGCLLEGLTGGIQGNRKAVTTGSELGLYLQRRVQTYPGARQTPDFGTFAFDDRGEMAIPLAIEVETQPHEVALGDAEALTSALSEARARAAAAMEQAWIARQASRRELEDPPGGELQAAQPEIVAVARPPLLADIARSAAPLSDMWRKIVLGVMVVGATLAIALLAFVMGPSASATATTRDRGPAEAIASSPPDANAGFDGSPSQIISARPVDCPPDMVRVPAGRFQMGSPDGVGDAEEHPQHEVMLSAYCIDRTEVTVKAYAECVAASGCSAALLTVSWIGYPAAAVKRDSRFCNRDDRPDHPINCVDWNQATAYCAWAGKRLPSEAEWEHAARGSDGRIYPWGNQAPSANRLNACGSECVAMAKRERARDFAKMYDASDRWETTAPVGRFPDGASPFGALDMAGNVWEWTADRSGPYTAAAAVDPHGAPAGAFRVLRGGGWINDDVGQVRAAFRHRHEASVRLNHVGFRCARDL